MSKKRGDHVQEMRSLLRESAYFLLLATIIFTLGSWVGYVFNDLFEALVGLILEQLKEIKELLDEKQSSYYTAWFIFQNNTKAAFMMIGLGTILFFLPMITLFVNGLAIGYLLKVAALNGMSPVDMLIFGILPHGVLELPAILVAGGIGIFLGVRLWTWIFRFILHLIRSDHRDAEESSARSYWEERGKPILFKRIKAVAFLALWLAVTLLVAAVVEGFITPGLIEKYIDLNI
jgi:stage II sporulation protein M